jgi:hypothetical protein
MHEFINEISYLFTNNTSNIFPLYVTIIRHLEYCKMCVDIPTFADRECCVVSATDPHGRILGFLDRSRYYFFQVVPQLYSRG